MRGRTPARNQGLFRSPATATSRTAQTRRGAAASASGDAAVSQKAATARAKVRGSSASAHAHRASRQSRAADRRATTALPSPSPRRFSRVPPPILRLPRRQQRPACTAARIDAAVRCGVALGELFTAGVGARPTIDERDPRFLARMSGRTSHEEDHRSSLGSQSIEPVNTRWGSAGLASAAK